MDEWLKEVVQKIESEGNKITSIKIVTKDATEFIKPEKIKTEREKVCDEIMNCVCLIKDDDIRFVLVEQIKVIRNRK
jgi:ABC-type Zn uptake system ZnuABC Zn-binding protein ZnuA